LLLSKKNIQNAIINLLFQLLYMAHQYSTRKYQKPFRCAAVFKGKKAKATQVAPLSMRLMNSLINCTGSS